MLIWQSNSLQKRNDDTIFMVISLMVKWISIIVLPVIGLSSGRIFTVGSAGVGMITKGFCVLKKYSIVLKRRGLIFSGHPMQRTYLSDHNF
jgi:hypothetical protein